MRVFLFVLLVFGLGASCLAPKADVAWYSLQAQLVQDGEFITLQMQESPSGTATVAISLLKALADGRVERVIGHSLTGENYSLVWDLPLRCSLCAILGPSRPK